MTEDLMATCAVTGKKEKLNMHAFRNENGDIIGWVFLNEDVFNKIHECVITVHYEWKGKTKGSPITWKKNRIDNL